MTLSWNHCVHQLLRIFCHLSGLGSPVAEAIFFSHQSDKGQRLLIKRVAESVGLSEPHRRELEKLLKGLDAVATGRNLAAHTIFGVSLFDPVTGAWGARVVPALHPPQDARLEADFEAQFRRVEHKLQTLYRRLEEWLIHTPYPERPWKGIPNFTGPIPGETEVPRGPELSLDEWPEGQGF